MAQQARRSYSDSIGHLSVRVLADDWFATPADDESRRAVLSGNTNSLAWHRVDVPGEWRSHAAFADHAGSVLYRVHLSHPRPTEDERTWIVSDGIFDQADLWLDSAYVGDQDDYFLRHCYDVTDLCGLDDAHELVIEVNGAHHAGIWAPISIKTSGPVAIDSVSTLCRDASEARAHLRMSADLDARNTTEVILRTSVDGKVLSEKSVRLSSGKNHFEWTVDIVNPQLWWPAALGDQPMSEVGVDVIVDGIVSDQHRARIGLREVSMSNWVLHVNGERLYAKGAYVDIPSEDFGTLTDDDASRSVRIARDLGLDLLRVRHHVAHPAMYDTADELGVLLWQDIPPHPRGKRGRRMVSRWAKGLVSQLGHHPSIVLWHHDLLDRSAHRALTAADSSRPVVSHASTTVPAAVTTDDRFSTVREFVAGVGYDLTSSLMVLPNIGRFPTDEQWQLIRQPGNEATAAHMLRRDIETLRRVKYSPAGGFCFPSLRDESVLTAGSALDSSDVPQASFYALEDACRPVIVVGTELPPTLAPGDEFEFLIHVVSDARIPLPNSRVIATVTCDNQTRVHEWTGDVDADSSTYIATLRLQVPQCDGMLSVDVQVEAGDYTASNSYATFVETP